MLGVVWVIPAIDIQVAMLVRLYVSAPTRPKKGLD